MPSFSYKKFICPHCEKLLTVEIEVTGLTTRYERLHEQGVEKIEPPKPDPPSRFSPPEQQVLDAALSAGLIEPFRQAVAAGNTDNVPKDIEKYFLMFLHGMQPRSIPKSLLVAFQQEFPGQALEFWGHQRVVAVIAHHRIRMFIPRAFFLGTRIKSVRGGGVWHQALNIDDSEALVSDWIRTRYGYVAGRGAMLNALRQPSIGAFARPGH